MTTRTVEKILKNASQKAGIAKHVTVHTLCHSFATYFLEGGIDLRYIQEIRVQKQRKSILTVAGGILDGLKALWILEVNDNKELQFEVSPEWCINEVFRKIYQFGGINEIVRLF